MVLKVGFVQLKQVVIGAENHPQISNGLPVFGGKGVNPGTNFAPLWTAERVVGIVKLECQGSWFKTPRRRC